MKPIYYVYIVFAIMSVFAFVAMGADKRKAQSGKWRTPEATLFIFAALGGGIGGTLGMKLFRHKTKHWYFKFGFPLLAALQIALLVWLTIKFA